MGPSSGIANRAAKEYQFGGFVGVDVKKEGPAFKIVEHHVESSKLQ